jgi:polar amino acid transport system substrate-binding protein
MLDQSDKNPMALVLGAFRLLSRFAEDVMKHFLLVSLLIGFGVLSSGAAADVISLRADPWCPYNCDPKAEHPGILIEIAKIVFQRAGHQIDYQLLNWARAKRDVKEGTITGIVGMARDTDTEKEYVFGDNEQAISQFCYFVRNDSTWTFTAVPALETEMLGVINGYGYYTELDDYIAKNKDTLKVQAVAGDTPLETNLNKLVRKRISVVVEDKLVLQYTLKTMNLSAQVKNAGCVDFFYPAHIAFSKLNPKSPEYARILSDGVAELRRTGELKKILDAYGVEDWK